MKMITNVILHLFYIFVVILQNIRNGSLCPNKNDDLHIFIYLFSSRHDSSCSPASLHVNACGDASAFAGFLH